MNLNELIELLAILYLHYSIYGFLLVCLSISNLR